MVFPVKVTSKSLKKAQTLKATISVKNPSVAFTDSVNELTVGATAKVAATATPATAKVNYYSADKSIATVGKTSGTVTAKAEGTVKVAAVIKTGTKTTKVYKEITVKQAVAELTDVKQTASNAFTATFTADASKITKDDIKVAAADGSSELAVKSVEVSADKLSANVTIYNNFSDAKEYNVTYKDATKSFKASVGEVTGVAVTTTEAQLNVKTAIKYVLTDANGIDVTPAVDLKSKCNIAVDGNYSTAEVGDASDAYITMTNEGDVAKVTISYDNGAKDFTPVTGSGEIKCVKAQAIKADALFTTSTDTNTKSQCARFYLGLSDKTVAIPEDQTKSVYFCAKDEDGKVVSYDKYDVQSSNEDAVTATVSTDSGKYAVLNVSGNTVGSASLTVTTSKNGAVKTYVIPVTVTKKDVAVKMTVDVDRRTMSNAVDSDYFATVTPKLYDAAGNEVTGTYTYEITNTGVTTPASITAASDNKTATFKAAGATATTYNVKVTGSDNKTSTLFTRNVTISVQALSDKAKANAGVAMTYAVEISKKALDPNDPKARTTTAKLYATCNGVFAGYVRTRGAIGLDSANQATAFADAKTKLSNIKVLAKYGTLTFAPGTLTSDNSTATSQVYTGAATFNCVKGTSVTYQANNYDTIAKNGTYTVEFELTYADGTKKVTNTFTVNNTVKVPTVTVDTRKANITSQGYVEALSTDVDMNNNTSSHESISGISGTNNEKFSTDGTKVTVKDVKVVDNSRNGLDWTFIIPINTTFTQK